MEQKLLGLKGVATVLGSVRFASVRVYKGRPWLLRLLDTYYRLVLELTQNGRMRDESRPRRSKTKQ